MRPERSEAKGPAGRPGFVHTECEGCGRVRPCLLYLDGIVAGRFAVGIELCGQCAGRFLTREEREAVR